MTHVLCRLETTPPFRSANKREGERVVKVKVFAVFWRILILSHDLSRYAAVFKAFGFEGKFDKHLFPSAVPPTCLIYRFISFSESLSILLYVNHVNHWMFVVCCVLCYL